jgi:hypothetical protein
VKKNRGKQNRKLPFRQTSPIHIFIVLLLINQKIPILIILIVFAQTSFQWQSLHSCPLLKMAPVAA